METTLAKLNEAGLTTGAAFNGVVQKGKPVTARAFLAAKFGVTLAKGSTFKTVKEAIIAKGNTSAALKAAHKEYDANMNDYYRASGVGAAVLAQDASFRKAIKMTLNKDGQPTGSYTIACRPIKGAISGPSARELALEQELQEMRAKFAALPA